MRGIEHLHPEMREKAKEIQALCSAKGLPLLITETWRTTAEQDALYAQGRTTPGSIVTNCKGGSYQSPHQWGAAFDFCKNVKGAEYSDTVFFKTVGALGKSIGLFWGGDFKSFVDMPHLELPKYLPNNSTATLKAKWGTPDKFKASWTETEDLTLSQYEELKKLIDAQNMRINELEGRTMPQYKMLDDVPEWGQEAVRDAIERGIMTGTSKDSLSLSWEEVRTLTLAYRRERGGK